MNAADRKWLRRQLAKLREDIRNDVGATLQDVLGEEARLIFLERMTREQDRATQ